ncbi:hypothetical protein RxyAA322_28350 [Rubrobacter xylanophilus]|uniref:Uncharacterized protein n=2 Tax=Rubrobacter xylanophilus TaxID=49319 RepID=A0A510HLS9_9ACTN|nr:hypothetical protein RxyAA322_28350 [Rubrobacter xylanophilus]
MLVGREAEKRLLQEAISSGEPPFGVLYVFGVGGSGKTALLREFAYLCGEAGVRAHHLDAQQLTGPPLPSLLERARPGRHVILLDGCERLGRLEDWVDEELIRRLPEGLLLVLAGRDPPPAEWETDPGWRSLVRTMPLDDLSEKESREYLRLRGLDSRRQRSVLEFAHGHPLALSLAADAARSSKVDFDSAQEPGVVRVLMERFVREVPGPAHRAALEVCALARHTTESLLAHAVPGAMPEELFGWLGDLDFVRFGRPGLIPHPTVREAVGAELRWRNPDRHAALLRRLRGYHAARLADDREEERRRALMDYLFLHREDACIRPLLGSGELDGAEVTPLRPEDLPALTEMIGRHEGRASAGLAELWLARRRAKTTVYRDGSGRPTGFVTILRLSGESLDDEAVRAAWRYLERHAPLRPGEAAGLVRFWMARHAHQGGAEVRELLLAAVLRHVFAAPPAPACTLLAASGPDSFRDRALARMGFARLPGADPGAGSAGHILYGHDWRVEPPSSWLWLLSERGPVEDLPSGVPPADGSLALLGEEEFTAAVREALRNHRRPEALCSSPLLRSRLLVRRTGSRSGEHERVPALQRLLLEAAEELKRTPRETKLYRALHHTYFQPAPTQEQAARLLDLPFSTYRRHLRAGTERVAAILWREELRGPLKPDRR